MAYRRARDQGGAAYRDSDLCEWLDALQPGEQEAALQAFALLGGMEPE